MKKTNAIYQSLKAICIILGCICCSFTLNADATNQSNSTLDAWVQRLISLQDHKDAAFRTGPELLKEDPDFAVSVVTSAWPQITNQKVKTGLLKAFQFIKIPGEPTAQHHPHVLKILNLGVSDSDPYVVDYALTYVAEYAFEKFPGNTQEYRNWYTTYHDKPLDQVIHLNHTRVRPQLQASLDNMITSLKEGRMMDVRKTAEEIGRFNKDPYVIPILIGIIDADNSYDTVYWVGYYGLYPITQVPYNALHDGMWWRRWWERNKSQFPDDVQSLSIPDLPKTEFGRIYISYPPDIDTPEGLISFLVQHVRQSEGKKLDRDIVSYVADEAWNMFKDYRTVPVLIGVMDSDNSQEINDVLNSALQDFTGVHWSRLHDSGWWKRWWAQNKSQFSDIVKAIPIPDLPKTSHGAQYKQLPENVTTLEGALAILHDYFSHGHPLPDIWVLAQEIADMNDPRSIPTLIGYIEGDSGKDMAYAIGYFGLSHITDVQFDQSHDGAWWRKWWEENKTKYPAEAQNIDIPDMKTLVSEWRVKSKTAQKEAAIADIKDISSEDIIIGEESKKRYFLIGADNKTSAPLEGYKLVVVMPGGDGSPDFNPFVRRIYKNALGNDYLIAEPVAFKWNFLQRTVWPTYISKQLGQTFSTEEFVEDVIRDVKKRYPINERHIFLIAWSSSGPAAYNIAMQQSTQITGFFIMASVYRPEWHPPLDYVKGRFFRIEHSEEDTVCPYSHAKNAEKELSEKGAIVSFVTYSGGHGWSDDPYGRVRRGIQWLVSQTVAQHNSEP